MLLYETEIGLNLPPAEPHCNGSSKATQ